MYKLLIVIAMLFFAYNFALADFIGSTQENLITFRYQDELRPPFFSF